MKCHYEVLGIGRDAEDGEIKKSYRKLALRLHPDKNPDNIEECTKQFHIVQQAYEVLIDPQERAWYDKHREAILRGGLGHGDGYEDNGLNVYQYYNTSCYSGYGDDERGFYTVYKKVFEELAAQDYEFMDDRDSDWEMPGFGNSQSSYSEVVGPFYAFWESFCTAKSYVWVETYDTREAPNRQVRRLMEQDNKKAREKGRRERNEEIRALVAFVRKRDKRVQAQKRKLEERAIEISRLTEERKEAEKRKRLKNLADYKESGWSAMSELETDLEHLEAQTAKQFGDQGSSDEETEGEEEEELFDDLFCVACNKLFKTDKAMANHERSKKHKENVAFLRAQMEEEEEEEEDEGEEVEAGDENDDDVERQKEMDELDFEDEGSLDLDSEDSIEDVRPKPKLSKKQKKRQKQQRKEAEMASKLSEDMKVLNVEDVPTTAEESPVAKEKEEDVKLQGDAPNCDNHELEEDKREVNSLDSAAQPDESTPPAEDSSPSTAVDGVNAAPSAGAAASTTSDQKSNKSKKSHPNQETQGISSNCNTCNQKFKSRSKLFEHLKVSGHAQRLDKAPIQSAVAAEGGGKGRKKKKGKR